MSFLHRKIELEIKFGSGQQGIEEGRTVRLKGLRIALYMSEQGGAGMGSLQGQVFGLAPDLINDLTTIGKLPVVYQRNIVTVYAGDDVRGMCMVWQGTLTSAIADMSNAPDVSFNILGSVGMIEAIIPADHLSYKGDIDAAIVIADLARSMGLHFENNGCYAILNNPYFIGAGRNMLETCARAAGFDWIIDNGTVAIWPKGSHRQSIPYIISPDTGMVGYPTYSSNSLIVNILYEPTIRFGQLVEVKSSLKNTDGLWRVTQLNHDIAAEMPGGSWFSQLYLTKPDALVLK